MAWIRATMFAEVCVFSSSCINNVFAVQANVCHFSLSRSSFLLISFVSLYSRRRLLPRDPSRLLFSVTLLSCNVMQCVLYPTGYPLPTEPVYLPHSWHKLTFLYCRAIKQLTNQLSFASYIFVLIIQHFTWNPLCFHHFCNRTYRPSLVCCRVNCLFNIVPYLICCTSFWPRHCASRIFQTNLLLNHCPVYRCCTSWNITVSLFLPSIS